MGSSFWIELLAGASTSESSVNRSTLHESAEYSPG
jgi:hypothetical protein